MGSHAGRIAFVPEGAHNLTTRPEAVTVWLSFNKLRPIKGKPRKAILAQQISHFLNATGSAFFLNLFSVQFILLIELSRNFPLYTE